MFTFAAELTAAPLLVRVVPTSSSTMAFMSKIQAAAAQVAAASRSSSWKMKLMES